MIAGDRITTASDQARVSVEDYLQTAAAQLRLEPPRAPAVELDPPLMAHIAFGGWQVGCPWCPNEQLHEPGAGVTYCLNPECPRPHGDHWLAVVDPPAADIAAAERLLVARVETVVDTRSGQPALGPDGRPILRAMAERRHWFPDRGETVDMLRRENHAHGFATTVPGGPHGLD